MVNAMSGLTVESTIDAFTEREIESAACAARLTDEPEEDEFVDRGMRHRRHHRSALSTGARPADVKALAKAAPPQYVRKARGTP